MTIPGGKFFAIYLHEAATGNETSDEMPVTGVAGGYTMLALGVEGLTGTIELQARVLDDEWVTVGVADVSDGSDATSITADGIYTRMVAGMVAIRTDLTGSGATVKAVLVA